MKIVNDKRDIDEILEEGLTCESEVCVYEVIDLIATMTKHIKETDSYKHLINECGKEYETKILNFLISFVCSEIATITGQFKERELPSGKA